jgi:acyl-CoA synthetase (AMP-forming)/AMP-acid ligase II
MNPALQRFDEAVASLTAPGQPFETTTATLDGVDYRVFASIPQNLGEYFKVMLAHADKDFAVYRDERYTFAEGYRHSGEFASALRDRFSVRPGERVAILSRNNPQWMMAFIGMTSIGAVAVPMNGWWTTQELDYGIADSGARVVVADRERAQRLLPIAAKHQLTIIGIDDCSDLDYPVVPFSQLLEDYAGAEMPAVAVAPDDHATIMYTSGSTGHPKGALSSHRGILSALHSWMTMGVALKMAGIGGDQQDRLPPAALVTIPLFHCTGSHSVFMLSLVVGRKMVIMHKWDVEDALRLIEEEKITWFNGVPTMSAELQAAAETTTRDVSSLKEIMGGGAARPPDQVGKLTSTFKGSSAGIGYGSTETNALGSVNSGPFYEARPGSAGRAVPPVTEIVIKDETGEIVSAGARGEVCIKSPATVLGYWNKPEATAETFREGWYHTGDVGYLDEEGFLYIVDRIKEIIIRGGENISCLEVEAAIYDHPGVREVAVFGLPDERLGEIVGAAVVPREGVTLDTATLQGFLQDHLAGFKIPAHIWFHTEPLPRIAAGKIFKRELKTHYAQALEQSR